MALVALPGTPLVEIGGGQNLVYELPATLGFTMDAANEAVIFAGHVATSDGGSHTINTTGSSSLGWRAEAVTFASGSTIVKVGLAGVDTASGPPARATNSTNVITFDVSKSLTGGGGGITASAWQTHVPDAGTKTIAHGDFIAFCIQMTARGGTDSVVAQIIQPGGVCLRPAVTSYLGATYTGQSVTPNGVITFADGALGWFYFSDVFSTISTRTWNNASAQKEYGQLFNLPFPLKIYGIYGWARATTSAADFDVVLYSSPLSGSPVAEKTVSMDANTLASTAGLKFTVLFPSPFTYTANTDIAAVLKPGATNISAYYKTMASASHRVTEPFGTSGYGINRSSGAFANSNSSLEHYYIGLLAGAFDAGGIAGRSVQINPDSLVG